MLTREMAHLVATYTIGCVATVRADGGPAVSPKATFLVIDDRTIAFANIRSQGTVENIRHHPDIEINFIDVFARKGCRIRGRARYVLRYDGEADLQAKFKTGWPSLYDRMRGFVLIDIKAAEMLFSPSYDVGASSAELTEEWLRRHASALGFAVARKGL